MYILSFVSIITAKKVFELELNAANYWTLLLLSVLAWPVLSALLGKKRRNSLDTFFESVEGYQVVEKYRDDPRWAIYLHFRTGEEAWNQTIPGSFCARDPVNDLTFVFQTQEEALKYAQAKFQDAVNLGRQ